MNDNTPGDVIAVLTHDHRRVQAFFHELDETRDRADPKQRRDLTDRVTIEFVRHAVAEEQFLYPAVRYNLDGGPELADREVREHALIEQRLKELEAMVPGDEPFEATLRHLMELVNEHFAEEERTLFPRFQSVCTDDDLAQIGKMVTAGKKGAPTGLHSGASDTAPGDLAAPGLGLIDRIRDALTGHGHGS